MAATTAKSLLRNRKPLPQILRAQILGRSSTNINVNNVAKDHQIVQSLFTSNQKLHAQLPVFGFGEMGSLLGTSPWRRPVEKANAGGMRDMVVEARGKFVIDDEFENDTADDDSDDNIGEEDFGDDSDEDDFNYYDETDNVSDDDEKRRV